MNKKLIIISVVIGITIVSGVIVLSTLNDVKPMLNDEEDDLTDPFTKRTSFSNTGTGHDANAPWIPVGPINCVPGDRVTVDVTVWGGAVNNLVEGYAYCDSVEVAYVGVLDQGGGNVSTVEGFGRQIPGIMSCWAEYIGPGLNSNWSIDCSFE